jgi:hypothetical protein
MLLVLINHELEMKATVMVSMSAFSWVHVLGGWEVGRKIILVYFMELFQHLSEGTW